MAWGGPYASTSWVNGTTPLSQTHLNNLETQYQLATQTFEQDLFTPFVLYGMVCTPDGTTLNQLDVTAGVAFLLQTDSTVARQSISSSSGPLTTSAHSATYYLDLNPNGTYSFATSHSGTANYLTIAQVTTDGSGNISTVTDERNLTTTLFTTAAGGTLSYPGGFTFGVAVSGKQSALYYYSPDHGVGIQPPQAGASIEGIYFVSWTGSASVTPFSIGGQFNSALSWIDNAGELNTAALIFGAAVSASQSQLYYYSPNHGVAIQPPQAGATAQGIYFPTWNGSSTVTAFSIGSTGALGGAVSNLDQSGNLSIGSNFYATGYVSGIGGQSTAGSFGVPMIVAQVIRTHIVSTGQQTILTYTPTAAGYYQVTGYVSFSNGTYPQTIVATVSWHDPDRGSQSINWFSTSPGAAALINAPGGGTGEFWADTGASIVVKYNDPGGTPNDYCTFLIRRYI